MARGRWPGTARWAGQHLLERELRQLGKALLEVHLRQDPAGEQAGSPPLPPPAAAPSQQPARSAQSPSPCSLVHRVKGLLQGRGHPLTFLLAPAGLLALGVSPGRLHCLSLLPLLPPGAGAGARAGLGGWEAPTALQAQPRDTPVCRRAGEFAGLGCGVGKEMENTGVRLTRARPRNREGSQRRMLTTKIQNCGQDPVVQTDKPEARGEPTRAWFRQVEGKRGGTEGQTGDRGAGGQAVVATPRLLGTHHGLRALGAGLILGRWGQRGTAPGCGRSRSRGAVEGLVLLASPQALARTLGLTGWARLQRLPGCRAWPPRSTNLKGAHRNAGDGRLYFLGGL